MQTRDKDFTDCNPRIANQIKKGKEILCKVWDEKKHKSTACNEWVSGYVANVKYCYQDNEGEYWVFATPIK